MVTLAGVPKGWARSRMQGDRTAPTPDLIALTLAPTTAFLTQVRAKAQPRGGFPSRGLCFPRGHGAVPRAGSAPESRQAPGCAGSASAAASDSANASWSQREMGTAVLPLSCPAHRAGQLKTFCFHRPHIFKKPGFLIYFFFP